MRTVDFRAAFLRHVGHLTGPITSWPAYRQETIDGFRATWFMCCVHLWSDFLHNSLSLRLTLRLVVCSGPDGQSTARCELSLWPQSTLPLQLAAPQSTPPFSQWALRMWSHTVIQSQAWPQLPPLVFTRPVSSSGEPSNSDVVSQLLGLTDIAQRPLPVGSDLFWEVHARAQALVAAAYGLIITTGTRWVIVERFWGTLLCGNGLIWFLIDGVVLHGSSTKYAPTASRSSSWGC